MLTLLLLSALIAKLKAVSGKFGFRASSYAIAINFENDSCLLLSVTSVMVRCLLAGVAMAHTWFVLGSMLSFRNASK